MRTPTTRFKEKTGAGRNRLIALHRELSRLTTLRKENSVSDCQRTLRRNAAFEKIMRDGRREVNLFCFKGKISLRSTSHGGMSPDKYRRASKGGKSGRAESELIRGVPDGVRSKMTTKREQLKGKTLLRARWDSFVHLKEGQDYSRKFRWSLKL